MPRSATFIINSRAGSAQQADASLKVSAICSQHGVECHWVSCDESHPIAERTREALQRHPSVVVGAGGDGTLNSVAGVLAGRDVPMGILPLGTLNHFAKDLNIPLDLEAAVRVAITGTPVSIDVAEVNGRVFINNSSLGIYPQVVEEREHQQQRGTSKWPAFLRALVSVARRRPALPVRISVDATKLRGRMPFVFVGNNRYEVTGLSVGSRHRLDSGVLTVILARNAARTELLWSALKMLSTGTHSAGSLELKEAQSVLVQSPRSVLEVAADGEVFSLAPPLEYRIRRGALKVILPASDEASA